MYFSLVTLALLAMVPSQALAATSLCPDGNPAQSGTYNNYPYTYCCRGGLSFNNNGQSVDVECIIGCSSSLVYASCFPFCSGSGNSPSTATFGTCTSVPITATNYLSIVYGATSQVASAPASASASAAASSAAPRSTLSVAASVTSASNASGATSTAAVTASGSTTAATAGSATNGGSSTSTSKAGAGHAAITQAPVLVLAGLAAGVALF